jgi:hypothetical protein
MRAIDREVRCNLSVLLRVDAEFFHSREESRAVHSQARGSTIGSAHAPLACSKCPYDLIALLCFIFVSNATFVTSRICSFSSDLFNFMQVSMHECFRIRLSKLCERSLKRLASRQEHGSLNEILEFTNIAGPVPSISLANFWTKWLTSKGMSSLRSLRGGIRIGKTFKR